ncbi:MAG: aminotransferase class V-fold PLP-dependent enzyme [Acidobacteriota bacterium]
MKDWTTERYLGLLEQAAGYARRYIEQVEDQPVFPAATARRRLAELDGPLPDSPSSPEAMLALLHEVGSPATVAQTAGRYFGFVNGGALPPAVAARWLADVWDQNAALDVMSPIAARLELLCERWLVQLFGLPPKTAAGFVTGTSASLLCGIVTARDSLLRRQGWDVHGQGLYGAPEIRVVAGSQAHAAARRALSLAGLGSERVEWVEVDDQGRLLLEDLPTLDDRTLVLAQAGNVNSGAFDPVGEVCRQAAAAGAWVHVDGAFGLWAGACRETAHLYAGIERADSWSVDAHKTLNVPYDCGIILCRHRGELAASLRADAAYLASEGERQAMHHTPDMSRRARAVELWACLLTLGRRGIDDLVSQLCGRARQLAAELEDAGFEICNRVVFNQVLVRGEDDAQTSATLRHLQDSGECWCGGTTWRGDPAIRVSVCSWATTEGDIRRTAAAFVAARRAAEEDPSARNAPGGET